MTGEQLRKLRESNGLSRRQLALALGFKQTSSPAKKVTGIERKPFVPETIVHRINKMVAEGKLTP